MSSPFGGLFLFLIDKNGLLSDFEFKLIFSFVVPFFLDIFNVIN